MPFCTSCGAELPADNKFCGQCGAPREPVIPHSVPVTPDAPVIPPSPDGNPPVQPKKPRTFLIIGAGVIVLCIISAAFFAGMPMLTSNQNSSYGFAPATTPVVTSTPEQTALPTQQYMDVTAETPTPPVPLRDERRGVDYVIVNTLDQTFSFGQRVNFTYNLTSPPLYIRFKLIPTMISRHRLVSIGTNNEHYENTTEISPNAWFAVTVSDAGTGIVIDKQGFGKDYRYEKDQEFMVRQKGNYRIEISGNEVTADVQMLIG
jgi:hypothetical protein